MGEVQGGRPSRCPGKQWVQVLAAGLQEKGPRVRAATVSSPRPTESAHLSPPLATWGCTLPAHSPQRGTGRRQALTAGSSSRLSLESSALCVDRAARAPRPSVTLLGFSPSVGAQGCGRAGFLQGCSPAAGARHPVHGARPGQEGQSLLLGPLWSRLPAAPLHGDELGASPTSPGGGGPLPGFPQPLAAVRESSVHTPIWPSSPAAPPPGSPQGCSGPSAPSPGAGTAWVCLSRSER